ncbi:hypothetical protein ATK30_5740 [Amycolatopsis echigonensis]|uniref:DoxX-like protein n=1 Tax=Amycolatopsis echigonensis TaxID=2576905 RepID=A0A2N3WLY2_9PSEU|nr:hypothetical protein [Amycolatopsis niigatensis]PKV94852.1 hypothetical protein ATK30_5740 [Amycolatopsis niigatensis]
MTSPTSPLRMPGRLRAALVFVFLQALLNGILGIFAQLEIARWQDHGQDPAGVLYLVEFLSYIFAAGLLASGIAILVGYDWGRWALLACEVLSAIGGLINLVSGSPQALLGLVLAGLVVTTLFQEQVKAWFEAKAAQRRAGPAPQPGTTI